MTIRRIGLRVAAHCAALAFAVPIAAQPVLSTGPQPGSTTVNFNNLKQDEVVTNQYPAFTVIGGLCGNALFNVIFNDDPMQVSNFSQANLNCNGQQGQPFTFVFAQALSSFGFIAATGGDYLYFTTPNGTMTVPLDPNGQATYAGFTDAIPFNWVTVSVQNNYLVLDDLSYTTAVTTTPEPASAVLLGTGLLAAVGVSRRRRSA